VAKSHLDRALTLFPTMAIVIGSVVGSGIFAVPAGIAREVGDASLILLIWVGAGLLTLFGGLTQSELVGQMPRTGGLYEYFHEIYGERMGFLYGWANLMIAGSGAIASIAIVFATYLGEFVTLPHLSAALEAEPLHLPMLGDIFPFANMGVKVIAVSVIIILTYINIRGVRVGATLQKISTSTKVIAILCVIGVAFIAGSSIGSTANWSSTTPKGLGLSGTSLLLAIGFAVTNAFWSYDGWGNVAYVGGEVKEPQRTIPRAIIFGTLIFIGIYLLMNLAYFFILPVEAVASAPGDRVASLMVSTVLGGAGGALVAALIMLSTFDTTNSTILANARVYYAMAANKVFAPRAASVHPKYRTPHIALFIQGAWSVVLVLTGSFGLLLDMYIFVNWLMYVFMALGVFILRRRNPDAERPFRTPAYPLIPLVFILFATTYVILTLVLDIQAYNAGERPILQSVTGLVLVLAGLPFYYFWKNKRATS
jgi:basic amino acid/polyamine antiporter, APA family